MKLDITQKQLEFIMDECKKSLEFGDYFDAYDHELCGLDTNTTLYLVAVTTLLHNCVTLKETNK
tara:strand:- start:1086 stop:1277 length:192 start_codon:yes stop_codon:yes gene_type:complete